MDMLISQAGLAHLYGNVESNAFTRGFSLACMAYYLSLRHPVKSANVD